MSALAIVLEQFDDNVLDKNVREQQEVAAAYAEGYAAGEAAEKTKQKRESVELAALATSFDSALKKLSSTMKADLCEAVSRLVEKVFPALSEAGFAEEVAASLKDTITINTDDMIIVSAGPENLERIERAFSEIKSEQAIKFEPDESLREFEIKIKAKTSSIQFDFGSATAECVSALNGTIKHLRGEEHHE